ncbi:MAG: hypothetical protein JO081_01515 [Alphaproteobacteria bacterium]|nr:hypothetical protein [Alphaproteobacteria bacterium]
MAKVRKRTWTDAKGEQSAWVADYIDEKRRRHIRTFKTRREANTWLDETKIESRQGVHTPASESVTIAEAGQLWLAEPEREELEASTGSSVWTEPLIPSYDIPPYSIASHD